VAIRIIPAASPVMSFVKFPLEILNWKSVARPLPGEPELPPVDGYRGGALAILQDHNIVVTVLRVFSHRLLG